MDYLFLEKKKRKQKSGGNDRQRIYKNNMNLTETTKIYTNPFSNLCTLSCNGSTLEISQSVAS